MRQIYHHSQLVHLSNDLFSKIRQPVVMLHLSLVVVPRGIGPAIGVCVGQSHIPDTQRVEVPQQPQAVFDGVTAFNADQGGNSAVLVRRFNVSGVSSPEERNVESVLVCEEQK